MSMVAAAASAGSISARSAGAIAVWGGCLLVGAALLLGRRRVRMFWAQLWGREHGSLYDAMTHVAGPVVLLLLGLLGLIAFIIDR